MNKRKHLKCIPIPNSMHFNTFKKKYIMKLIFDTLNISLLRRVSNRYFLHESRAIIAQMFFLRFE